MAPSRTHRAPFVGARILFLAVLSATGCGDSPSGVEEQEELVEPELAFVGKVDRSTPNGVFVDYLLEVTNRSEYAVALFSPRSDLPSCGVNTGSRTWVEIYLGSGDRVYGYCAFEHPARLAGFSFPIPPGVEPPDAAYIELWDRVRNIRVRSNLVVLD